MAKPSNLTFYEFFAGGGMARAGLGRGWRCTFANDIDRKKSASYRANWGDDALATIDVGALTTNALPGEADLAWASFPCQDLSLAGNGAGLGGERSGVFWPFWSLMKGLAREKRPPKLIALENVCGALTSHGGRDFAALCKALGQAGYVFGALVIDASHFLPQSRPRLFIIAAREDIALPNGLMSATPSPLWHTKPMLTAHENLADAERDRWLWWALPKPKPRAATLADLIEEAPDIRWHSAQETRALLALMSPVNRAKVDAAKTSGVRAVGAVYKRRRVENGVKTQRAEVRFDGLAGCLRTPAGGSSRQTILIVEKGRIRTRLISARETARLMGLPDSYVLPERYNDAYHLTGDGVAVPAVRNLAKHLLEPLLLGASTSQKRAA